MVLGQYSTIPVFRGPEDRDFSSIDRRRNSFVECQNESISVSDFSEAGFHFLGETDAVRCFSCGIVFETWKVDDPRVEHAKFEMDCPHLYLNKG